MATDFASCSQKTSNPIIVLEERGVKVTIVNPSKAELVKVQVDNCMCCNEMAADWVVARSKIGEWVIELKSSEIERAIKQVNATASKWTHEGLSEGVLNGLVVSRQRPVHSSSIAVAKDRFRKKYNGKLEVINPGKEVRCSQLFP